MKTSSFAATLATLIGTAFAGHEEGTFAVLRFTNKQLTQGRMDPIVWPGKASAHVHTIMGGNGFSLSSNGEDLTKSTCTNAMVKGDNSNYWFPSLYFRDPKDGTFEPVEIFYVNAYYFFEKSHDDIKAFPLGMSMVSGDATTRVVPEAGVKTNLDPSKGPVNPAKWTCPRLNGNYNPPSWPADSDGSMAGIGDPVNLGEGIGFPDQNCDGYASPLRADVHFPSCYNPKAGLTNFAENMAWPSDNKGYLDCPEGYIHVPHLFLEVYWNTPEFVDRWEQGTGHQPFVLSSGDATGFSSHGDFMSGWDEELLQHIIDTCNTGTIGMDKCPGLFYGVNKEECTMDSLIDEKIDGVLDKLPGNNPLQGWSYGVTGSSSPPSSGEGDKSSYVAEVPSATSEPVENESSTKAPVRETTTKPSTNEETTAAAVDDTPTTASAESEVTTATSKSATYGGSRPDFTVTPFDDVPKATAAMTGVFGKLPPSQSAKSSCKRKTHTVYETVTVTQTVPESPVETPARQENSKREQLRRHVHDHHAHAHRRRSHHH